MSISYKCGIIPEKPKSLVTIETKRASKFVSGMVMVITKVFFRKAYFAIIKKHILPLLTVSSFVKRSSFVSIYGATPLSFHSVGFTTRIYFNSTANQTIGHPINCIYVREPMFPSFCLAFANNIAVPKMPIITGDTKTSYGKWFSALRSGTNFF